MPTRVDVNYPLPDDGSVSDNCIDRSDDIDATNHVIPSRRKKKDWNKRELILTSLANKM